MDLNNKFPKSLYNPLTLISFTIALLCFILILFSLIYEFISGESKPYIGIISFIILPAILLFSLFIGIIGIIRENKRLKKEDGKMRNLPIINLNIPQHRNTVVISFISIFILILFTGLGSWKAYEYTDSDEFCGTTCHEVMHPEYTAYKNSPHARVGCAKCHIGPGADWFVQSKLSGVGQVIAVLLNSYSRPIATPINNLRPARETCEQCHWPAQFYQQKKVDFNYYLSDENNTHYMTTLLMRIGGGSIEKGTGNGIHWKMYLSNEISYYTNDPKKQNIPYIKVKSLITGKETIYKTKDFNENVHESKLKTIDCIECHNRPSHIYRSADKMVNNFMSEKIIDPSLPFIKSVCVQALEKEYKDSIEAKIGIEEFISNYYKTSYPELFLSDKNKINSAINAIWKIYSGNYFPIMKVSWKKYPSHLEHLYSQGCFACHDGKHFSSDGKSISNDCNICHVIAGQGTDVNQETNLLGLQYKHPVDIGDSMLTNNCKECHGF